MILRIEDTDEERSRPEWIEAITSAMTWLGIDWDEGPFLQSQRGSRHREAAERLLASGHAYWCNCTREQIEARTRGSATPGYDSVWIAEIRMPLLRDGPAAGREPQGIAAA